MKWSVVKAGVGSFAVAMISGAILAAQAAPGPMHDLRERVAAAVQAGEDRATHLALFKAVRDSRYAPNVTELCIALNELPNEELALMSDAILKDGALSKSQFPCTPILKERLAAYWQAMGAESGPAFDPASLEEGIDPKLRIPCIEKEIDPHGGELLKDQDFKPGEIAITIDDGPDPKRTLKVARILRQFGVRATYFNVGTWASHYPEITRELIRQGHSVGSHSWSHPWMTNFPLEYSRDNILKGHEAVTIASRGKLMPFFRFPFGAFNKPLTRFVHEQGLANFFWIFGGLERTKIHQAGMFIGEDGLAHSKAKGILLTHDTHDSMVDSMPSFMKFLKQKGMTAVVFVPKKR